MAKVFSLTLFFGLLITAAPYVVAQSQTLTIEEYEPKSTLVTKEHKVERAKFPFVDIHSHHNNPSPAEVDKLVKDAQSHTEDDKKRRRVAEARNQADSLLYSTEKNLSEHGDKIGEDDKTKITEAIAGLRKAMEGDDPAAIETATQTLTTASHKLAEEMYKKASAAAGAGAAEAGASTGDAGAQAKTDEKVVDAEFEEVDKDKK